MEEKIPVKYPKCPKCKDGLLHPIPTEEGMPFGMWKCNACGYEVKRD